ncbi:MAG: glycerol-3-phosphate dehydrogenase [Myxococcota bacterium]
MPSREEMWDQVPDHVDVVVIGGGINGAGIARDAARRGLRVALFEQNDFAFGTSSRSSKLIHGGLRYLETYELGLVFESVSERRIVRELAPHLVTPLAFIFPVYEGSRKSLWLINIGMWLYDSLSMFRSTHRTLKPRQVADEEPTLKQDDLRGAPIYYDCATNDARLTLENAIDAADHGASVVSWAPVQSLLRDADGRVSGIVAKDTRTGALKEVEAPVVINATGPWADGVLNMGDARRSKLLRPTKGVHIVVDAEKLPVSHAVALFHPTDDRAFFAVPWGDCTYVGTTDTDYDGAPGEEHATLADIDYLIEAANFYFCDHPLTRGDVISTWSGLRPLVAEDADSGSTSESRVSREHRIVVGEDGLITVAGGKLTTFRKMSKETVDTAVRRWVRLGGEPSCLRPSDTGKHPLPGAKGWSAGGEKMAERVREASDGSLPLDVCSYLARTYGVRALEVAERCASDPAQRRPVIEGRPEIVAQIDWAVTEEFAASVSDVLVRRTQVFYRDRDQGLGAVDEVAARMGAIIGWSEDERRDRVEEYRLRVALSRRWRTEAETVPKDSVVAAST